MTDLAELKSISTYETAFWIYHVQWNLSLRPLESKGQPGNYGQLLQSVGLFSTYKWT